MKRVEWQFVWLWCRRAKIECEGGVYTTMWYESYIFIYTINRHIHCYAQSATWYLLLKTQICCHHLSASNRKHEIMILLRLSQPPCANGDGLYPAVYCNRLMMMMYGKALLFLTFILLNRFIWNHNNWNSIKTIIIEKVTYVIIDSFILPVWSKNPALIMEVHNRYLFVNSSLKCILY